MTSRTLTILIACTLVLSGCARVGESRLNPFNWFGSSEEEAVVAVEVASDPRPLVAQVTSLAIERTPTGAIVRATGLPPEQGWYAGQLVPETDGPVEGVMTYRFRAAPPIERTRVSTLRSREMSVAAPLSTVMLAETRVVQVIAAGNVRTVRR